MPTHTCPMSTLAHSSSEVSRPQEGSAPLSDPWEQSQMLTQQHDVGGWKSPCRPAPPRVKEQSGLHGALAELPSPWCNGG